MGDDSDITFGTASQFASHYETFLDAVYPRPNRVRLAATIGERLNSIHAQRVLDCAAGTGFPALNLAADSTLSAKVHCSDASTEMLNVLARKAEEKGVEVDDLKPDIVGSSEQRSDLRIGWDELGTVPAVYDYVMCRGNSLIYANTWDGRREVTGKRAIGHYLSKMSARLRPGGYLHVDAPWTLALPPEEYRLLTHGEVRIVEQVTIESDRRRWYVRFELPSGKRAKFERFSTLITVYDVAEMLRHLGFERTRPIRLPGERKTLGVIIARKRHGPHRQPAWGTDGRRLADYVRT